MDAGLLDYYHIINAPILLYDKQYVLHKTAWGRLCMSRL